MSILERTHGCVPWQARSRRLLCLAAAALVVSGTTSAEAYPADARATLQGEGQVSGVALAAVVDVTVLDPHRALVHVRNTSPPSGVSLSTAPVLTRLSFDMVGGPSPKCLTVSGPVWWTATGRSRPPCEGAGGGLSGVYGYGFSTISKYSSWGVRAGESVDLLVYLNKHCAGGFVFTPGAFLDAKADGTKPRWAAVFHEVGPNGYDGGCASGSASVAAPVAACKPEVTWATLVANTSDTSGLPSFLLPSDSRAGSVEITVNGGDGFDTETEDPPFEAGIVSIRNGANTLLEQWQVNRYWAAGEGCVDDGATFVCWISKALNLAGLDLPALVPTMAGSSNDGFDESGDRVEVRGELHVSYSGGHTLTDNSHETAIFEWSAPLGLQSAQLLIRAGYNSTAVPPGVSKPSVILFRRNFPLAADYAAPGVDVTVTHVSARVSINLQEALERICERYDEVGLLDGSPTP